MSEQEPGAAEKAKGLTREVVGAVLGDEEMKAEGREERKGTEGHKAYFRRIIEESNRRAAGKG